MYRSSRGRVMKLGFSIVEISVVAIVIPRGCQFLASERSGNAVEYLMVLLFEGTRGDFIYQLTSFNTMLLVEQRRR